MREEIERPVFRPVPHLVQQAREPKNMQKLTKHGKKRFLQNNCFFPNFKWYFGGLGVSGGMAWTIRGDSLELWQGLVLHGMGEVDFHGY